MALLLSGSFCAAPVKLARSRRNAAFGVQSDAFSQTETSTSTGTRILLARMTEPLMRSSPNPVKWESAEMRLPAYSMRTFLLKS